MRSYRALALVLIAATLVYNFAEGAVAIISGISASSIVLLGFGADSYLEVLAAGAVLWRMSHRDEEAGERAEQRVVRLIGATFLVLALAIVVQSAYALAYQSSVEESRLGLLLLALSLVLMPILSIAKLWVAAKGRLPLLAAEAKETVACSYLTITAFLGVAVFALFGAWWLDPVAALLMVPWLIKEGREGLRAEVCFEGAEPCFCASCLFGLRRCRPTCCIPACC